MIQVLGTVERSPSCLHALAKRATRAAEQMGQLALLVGPSRRAVAVSYTDRTFAHALTQPAPVGVYTDAADLEPVAATSAAKTLQAQIRADLLAHMRPADLVPCAVLRKLEAA